jgi:hypothetical protein
MTITEKAERAARKRTRRDLERAPLLELSGDLHHWTGDEMQAEWDWYAAKQEESEARLFARGVSFRERVARFVNSDELARLDVQRKMYPKTACYSADFWRCELMKLEAISGGR